MRLRCPLILVAGLLSALALSCGENSGAGTETTTELPLRLLELEDRMQLEIPDAEPLDRSELLLESDFTEIFPEPWFEGTWEIGHARGDEAPPRTRFSQIANLPDSDERALALDARSRGVHAFLEVGAGPVEIEVCLRAAAGKVVEGALQAQTLLQRPPRELDWSEPPPLLRRLRRPWGLAEPHARLAPKSETTEYTQTLTLPWDDRRQGIRITVVVTRGQVWLDRVRVRSLGAGQALIEADRTSEREPGTPAYLGEVGLELGLCPSLRLLPGWTMRIPLELPDRPLRLHGWLGWVGGNQPVSARLELSWNSRTLASVPVEAGVREPPTFRPFDVALGNCPGAGDLNLRVVAPEQDAVLVIGSPTLIASDATAESEPSVPSRAGTRPNLVLVSLDTLRADALGCYGQTLPLSPRIDAIAADGVRFANMLSPSSYTLPTHATMMTGQNPRTHGVRVAPSRMHPTETRLLAEVLQDAGYATAAYTGGGFLHPLFGFHRGFDGFFMDDPGAAGQRFGDPNDPPPGEGAGSCKMLHEKLAPALGWIESHAERPFFLFLHTFLVHNYTADPRYLVHVDPPLRELLHADKSERFDRAMAGNREAAEELRQLYLATVAQADAEIIGTLEDKLDELGLLENTLFVLVSDHGEAFVEHGAIGHGMGLWNTLVRVPWILRGPGVPRGVVRPEDAALQDLAPTVLGRLGLPVPDSMLGVDRFAETELALPQILDLDTLTSDGPERWDGIVTDGFKLLREELVESPDGDGSEEASIQWSLFDQRADPLEQADLSEKRPQLVLELRQLLESELERLEGAAPSTPALATSPNANFQEMLERLGYLHR